MVYIRLPTWKTAIRPQPMHLFDQQGNYTPTQKLMLTRNRIWGNIVGAGDRSGYKEMARGLQGKTKKSYYEFESLKL